ncbi:MAG TPA: alpha-hydroxy acid oxidase [Steroidobacteraceae bacterium]|nr:alpha-hydroxy acid oxidase [Steroidobacteraceae bacterium]
MRAFNIADLRQRARARLPRMVFDYMDGGADDECTLRANVQRFREYELTWDVLRDIAALSTATTVLGSATQWPFLICPTAASRLFDPRGGERAVARAAHAAGVIYSCSALATTSFEDIAAVNPGPKWFQLYAWKDRGILREMLARAKAAGFTAAILTVDVPVAGNRERDLYNDFTVPPRVTPRTALQALACPGYLCRLWSTPTVRPEIVHGVMPTIDGSMIEFLNRQLDHSLTWPDIVWMIDAWAGEFAIKGVSTAADARRCVEIGATGVWISNHGGRQLDTAPATIDMLEPVVQAVAHRAQVILDGGIRRGTDIVKALALGARAVGIGRAYLYGLAAAGEAGVARALALLGEELRRDLALMGYTDIQSIRRESVIAPHQARQ